MVLAASAAIVGFGFVVLLLWNVLMPSLFGLSPISFWQALELVVLARILSCGMGTLGMRGKRLGRFGAMRGSKNLIS